MKQHVPSQPPHETSQTLPSLEKSQVLSSIAVRSNSLPSFKRKVLKVDEAIRRRKRVGVNHDGRR